jgi:DNA invertase Pin-like site-specific DNA recombinase
MKQARKEGRKRTRFKQSRRKKSQEKNYQIRIIKNEFIYRPYVRYDKIQYRQQDTTHPGLLYSKMKKKYLNVFVFVFQSLGKQ